MKKFVFVLGVLLSLVFFSCSDGSKIAEKPVIINSTNGPIEVYVGEALELSCYAEVSDGGYLSYIWYEDSYQLDFYNNVRINTNYAGVHYYYCEVTNTLGNSTSTTNSPVISVTIRERPNNNPDYPYDSEKSDDSNENSEEQVKPDNNTNESNNTSSEENNPVKSLKKTSVKFDFSGAKAVAKLEAETGGARSARAASGTSGLGDYVKIRENGNMENAIIIEDNCNLAEISDIYISPLEDSNDVFMVFDDNSTIGYEEVEKEWEWGGTYTESQAITAGQLICVHEDGSIEDILRKKRNENSDSMYNMDSYMSLKKETVSFDGEGNVYFACNDWSTGDIIYQYNPSTNELSELVARVENTYYEKMQLSKDGQWIFVSGSRGSNYFLRAIPVTNPDAFVNVFYSSSSNSVSSDKWAYDENSQTVYYIASLTGGEGLWTVTKAGGFKDKKLIGSSTPTGEEKFKSESFFEVSRLLNDCNVFEWRSRYCDDDGNFSASILVDKLFESAFNNIYEYIYSYDKETDECIYTGYKYYYDFFNRDTLDIRFDAFKDETDVLKVIYELTKGKKNEEAFEALNCKEGLSALYELYYRFTYYDEKKQAYKKHLLASIFYVKDTDELLVESDKVFFSYYEQNYVVSEDGDYLFDEYGNYQYEYQEKTITGALADVNIFSKREDGYYSSVYYPDFVYGSNNPDLPNFICSSFTKTNDELLEYFFSLCNVEGEKEFRLTAFNDTENYKSLYSELTDGDALDWLAADKERLSLFAKAIGLSVYTRVDDNNVESDDSSFIFTRQDYNSYENKLINDDFHSFITNCIYIKGTDKKAVSWNWEQMLAIPYSIGNSWFNGSYPRGILSSTDSGIFYEFTNLYDNWYSSSTSQPFYYIVQVTDENGKLVQNVNKIELANGKVANSAKVGNRMIIQYGILDDSGDETGYHEIYSVDLTSGQITNCFESVPNNDRLEVVSFNGVASTLYFSAVYGTSVINYSVNLETNLCEPLGVQRKMTQIFAF